MKKVIGLLLVIALLLPVLAEDAYVPPHGIAGAAFGCSPDEYLEATRGLNVRMKVFDKVDGEQTIRAQSQFLYYGLAATIGATFRDDRLSSITLNLGTDQTSSTETAVFYGMIKLKTIYPELHKLYGEPIVVLEETQYYGEDKKTIQYRYPLIDGEPNFENIEKYLVAQTGEDTTRFYFIWDNMSLEISTVSIKWTKSEPVKYYSYVDCHFYDKPVIPDPSALIPYAEPSQNMFY